MWVVIGRRCRTTFFRRSTRVPAHISIAYHKIEHNLCTLHSYALCAFPVVFTHVLGLLLLLLPQFFSSSSFSSSWRFGPFSGHGLTVCRVARPLSFYDVGGWQPDAHPPAWMDRISLCPAPRSEPASSVLVKQLPHCCQNESVWVSYSTNFKLSVPPKQQKTPVSR